LKLFTIDRARQLKANDTIRLFNDYAYVENTEETEQWLQLVRNQYPAELVNMVTGTYSMKLVVRISCVK